MKIFAAAAVSATLALACRDGSKPPPRESRIALARVTVGSWAEYVVQAAPENSKLVVAVVSRDARGTVVESTITSEGAPKSSAIVERRTYALSADLGATPLAAAVQVGGFPPMSKDPADADATVDLAGLRARKPDAEEIVDVPAGRFACSRYRLELSPTEASDVWLSSDAIPTGIVKMTWHEKAVTTPSEPTASMLLLRLGSGAVPTITTQPAAFDADKLTSQLVSIAAPRPSPERP